MMDLKLMSQSRTKTSLFFVLIIISLLIAMVDLSSPSIATEKPIDNYDFYPNIVSFSPEERIYATGLNSTQVEATYNPQNKQVYLSWIDLYKPFTPDEDSTIYYSYGNFTNSFTAPDFVTSINETLVYGYDPAYDASNSVHIPYEEYITDNFEINEVEITNGITVQPESNIITNAGDSKCPVARTDSNGIVHLIWCDTTDNLNGDLYYTNYSSATGLWKTPAIRITNGADVNSKFPITFTLDENNTIHLVWVDERVGDQELYYVYSEDGVTWSSEEKITNVPYEPVLPKITFNKGKKKLHVVFNDNGTTTNLYHISANSKALGAEWSTPEAIDSYLSINADYDLYSDDFGNSLLVYERNVTNQVDIYLKQISNSSSSWGIAQIVSPLSYDPTIIVDSGGNILIFYTKLYQSATEVYIKIGLLDTDQDGLSDADEINIYLTDPNAIDSDLDTVSDGNEVLVYGSNPNDSDTDDDQMPDGFEADYSLNLTDASDASEDIDNDDLSNLQEYLAGTNPYFDDTDFDNISDGDEVLIHGTNPNNIDTDGDTLPDDYEITFGNDTHINPIIFDNITADYDNDDLSNEIEATILTDPLNPDTDGDGFTDGEEHNIYGTDPLDAESFPVTQEPKDIRRIVIGILVGVGIVVIFVFGSLLIASQFRPAKSSQRKKLERDEKELFDKQASKGREMKYEASEREAVDDILKRRKELGKDEVPTEEVRTIEDIAPEPSVDEIASKKAKMQEIILALKDYEQKLTKMYKKDLTTFNVSTVTREALTEFAADSQSIYSEAKATWTSTILPLIKGFEEKLHGDTLEAEKIIDSCKNLSDKILDVLVKREMEIIDEEARREEIKHKAQEALKEQEAEQEKSEETEEIIEEKEDSVG
jgi:hypothetical protein